MRYLLIISLIALGCTGVSAQVPGTLSYQGFLADQNGAPVIDGSYSITLRFYAQESGGTALETRGPLTVSTYKGLFNAVLGDGTSDNAPLPSALWDQEIYVGITVSPSTTELQPRVRLTTVPYAFVANSALTVPASGISGTIPNTLLDEDLQDLADGTLTHATLSLEGTGASRFASGSTSQRPPSPLEGQIRYNTEEKVMEYFNGTNWYFITPQVAYLSDVKQQGTQGGDVISSDWRTRTLNTTEGDDFVSLSSSSQFTLPAGEYLIEANAQIMRVDRSKLRIRSIGGDDITRYGTSAYSSVEASSSPIATLFARFQIDTPTTFELQQYCQSSHSGNGFGVESNFNGAPEIFALVKITKLR